jgi:hypothetical protein
VWQPEHFSAKIGATFAHVGAPPEATRRLPSEPEPEPDAIVVAAIATSATAATARASLLRFTGQG